MNKNQTDLRLINKLDWNVKMSEYWSVVKNEIP